MIAVLIIAVVLLSVAAYVHHQTLKNHTDVHDQLNADVASVKQDLTNLKDKVDGDDKKATAQPPAA